ncbi:N-acetylglucosamine-6-phosphate deacetylase [Marinovum sp.]|uniref:N-acetylglucosamine-6-phosphate deacetylase n=1 Tax=Marinovum sp. TaxID=2024839 RepID=UPI002B27661B|nr:N-acetylglucosamine-6-phosphate deacetylase [Marinovum sp.]
MPTAPDFILEAATLFPGAGAEPLPDRSVLVRGGRIEALGARGAFDGLPRIACDVAAPGFIDIQINGAGDRQFNESPYRDGLSGMVQGAAKGGTAHLLATYITAPGLGYQTAMAAVSEAVRSGLPGLLGLHLEGPFISPQRPGIHPPGAIRQLDAEDLAALCTTADHPRLITLAPEECDADTIARLTEAGWRVFLGHSMADYETVERAVAAGMTGATHLFNAMPPLAGRAPGPVGAVLDGTLPLAGIIADGIHVHPANLALACAVAGWDRLCLVTDAMLTLGGTATEFTIGAKTVTLRGGRLADADGRLGGAHLAMDEAVRNMIRFAGLSPQQALAMAATTPARALGLEAELGRIAPGFRASLAICDDTLNATATISDGVLLHLSPEIEKRTQWAAFT